MKIALDYDGTITSDPVLWMQFVALAKMREHSVTIVTARHPDGNAFVGDNDELEEFARLADVKIVYTNLEQKQDVFGADIWIDDRPDMVVGREQMQYLVDKGLLQYEHSLNDYSAGA